jgi:hypothetical protein
MSALPKMTFVGLVGGIALLGARGAGLAATTDASAAVADNKNPYSVIIARNVFRLNATPAPEARNGPQADVPVVKLSGFAQTAGQLRVLLAVKTKTGGAAAPESTSYLTLAVGERSGGLELVGVHADQERIDIVNSGIPMTLSMKDNGFAGPASGPVAARASTPDSRAVQGAAASLATLQANVHGLAASPVSWDTSAVVGGTLVGGGAPIGGGRSAGRGGLDDGSAPAKEAPAGWGRQTPPSGIYALNSGSFGGDEVSDVGSDNNLQGGLSPVMSSRDPWVLNMGYVNLSHPAPANGGDLGRTLLTP